jgi:protein-tyrosine phosphatase
MGFFSRLFSSAPANVPDLSQIGCDVHSHFIPGIDDGAQKIEDSLDLIRSMQMLGYKKVITTPHVMSDSFKNTPEIILSGLEKVRSALKEANIEIPVSAAAEYYLDYEFEQKIGKEKLLTFGDNYLLFEISYMNPPENLHAVVFKLQMAGYKPILAHPERYNFWHGTFNKYEELKEKGLLFQLNINSLTGYYSPSTKKISERMIENNMINMVGSDCHHMGHIELLKKAAFNKHLIKLVDEGNLINQKL